MDGTVLVADDDRTIRTVLTQALTRAGCRVHATSSLTTLMRWVEEGKGNLVISDVMMPDGNGLELLPKIAEERPGLPVIVISAQNTIMTAIRAAEADAYDYLPKPFDLPDLMKRAARALSQNRETAPRNDADETPPQPQDLPLVGSSPPMQALYRLIARIMNADIPVLITGESGAGKSLIAKSIHDLSDRRALPLVVADATWTDEPDAAARLIAKVRGGTLVFDEVGDFAANSQLRIIRLLDNLPDPSPRVMATSRLNLRHAVEQGTFREDLYFRLCGAALAVPSLREKVEDIDVLVGHFLQRADDGLIGPVRSISAEAVAKLRQFSWPGNIRQLEHTVRHLALTSANEEISPDDVAAVLDGMQGNVAGTATEVDNQLSKSVAQHLRRYFELHGTALPAPGVYQRILREIELPMIEIALDATGGNQAKCAELLGINRNTLRKKVTDLDIRVTRRRKLM